MPLALVKEGVIFSGDCAANLPPVTEADHDGNLSSDMASSTGSKTPLTFASVVKTCTEWFTNLVTKQQAVSRLLSAIRSGNTLEVLEALTENAGVLAQFKSAHDGNTVWHLLAEFGDASQLQALINFLKIHAYTDELQKLGARYAARACNSEELIHILVNAGNKLRQTPLMFAAYHGREESVKLLLQQGADPWARDRCGNRTALHYACRKGHVTCVRAILDELLPSQQQNALNVKYVDVRTASGYTPLHFAVAADSVPCVRALLAYGANLQYFNWYSSDDFWVNCPPTTTPLHLAAMLGMRNVAMAILRTWWDTKSEKGIDAAGEDPRRYMDKMKRLPFQVAQKHGYEDLADRLHPTKDIEGMWSPADLATYAGSGTVPSLAVIVAKTLEERLTASIQESVDCMKLLGTYQQTGRVFNRKGRYHLEDDGFETESVYVDPFLQSQTPQSQAQVQTTYAASQVHAGSSSSQQKMPKIGVAWQGSSTGSVSPTAAVRGRTGSSSVVSLELSGAHAQSASNIANQGNGQGCVPRSPGRSDAAGKHQPHPTHQSESTSPPGPDGMTGAQLPTLAQHAQQTVKTPGASSSSNIDAETSPTTGKCRKPKQSSSQLALHAMPGCGQSSCSSVDMFSRKSVSRPSTPDPCMNIHMASDSHLNAQDDSCHGFTSADVDMCQSLYSSKGGGTEAQDPAFSNCGDMTKAFSNSSDNLAYSHVHLEISVEAADAAPQPRVDRSSLPMTRQGTSTFGRLSSRASETGTSMFNKSASYPQTFIRTSDFETVIGSDILPPQGIYRIIGFGDNAHAMKIYPLRSRTASTSSGFGFAAPAVGVALMSIAAAMAEEEALARSTDDLLMGHDISVAGVRESEMKDQPRELSVVTQNLPNNNNNHNNNNNMRRSSLGTIYSSAAPSRGGPSLATASVQTVNGLNGSSYTPSLGTRRGVAFRSRASRIFMPSPSAVDTIKAWVGYDRMYDVQRGARVGEWGQEASSLRQYETAIEKSRRSRQMKLTQPRSYLCGVVPLPTCLDPAMVVTEQPLRPGLDVCGVCMDNKPLLEMRFCRHRICIMCAKAQVHLLELRQLVTCPYCNELIHDFTLA